MKLKEKKGKSRIIVEYFNTSLSEVYRTSRQQMSKDIEDPKDTVNQLHPTDISRTFHPITAEYTLFSRAHETFLKIDHIMHCKTNLNKFKGLKLFKVCSQTMTKLTRNQ